MNPELQSITRMSLALARKDESDNPTRAPWAEFREAKGPLGSCISKRDSFFQEMGLGRWTERLGFWAPENEVGTYQLTYEVSPGTFR